MDEFEFDDHKSKANLEKHGIDFESARTLWEDSYLLEVRAKAMDEERFLLIGRVGEKHWSAVVTHGARRIRMISVRRSRKKEVELYES